MATLTPDSAANRQGPQPTSRPRRPTHGLFACAHCWLLTLWTMGVLGLGAAILLAARPENVRHYNLSSLGVDERVAPLFNGTLILVGGGFFVLAFLTYRLLRELQSHGRLSAYRAYSLALPLILVGLALIGAAVFRLDGSRGGTVHIISSLLGLVTILFLMLTPLGLLGALFSWLSRATVGVIGTLFALSSEHLLASTIMEIVVLLLVSGWLLYLQLRLRALAAQDDLAS